MNTEPSSSSDSAAQADKTERAPTLVRAAPPSASSFAGGMGQKIGDFVLLRELGRGGFAKVYLAHQVSLERRVALKISRQPSRGEGQTLGGLEHDHIVKVYAEFDDVETGQRGLVLQYIPGTSLADVVAMLHKDGQRPRQGAEILQAIDLLARDEVDFDPAALRDRDVLASSDFVVSVCRLGAKLAEALAFAHQRGILHCDIKPANILLNRYGRPLLVDFNVAVPIRAEGEKQGLGGTVLYMAPEQLAAFSRLPGGDVQNVDLRCDLYSLGLVLIETLVGRLLPRRPSSIYVSAAGVMDWKLQAPEEWLPQELPFPSIVWRVLRRCVDPDPAKRYASGTQLAAALHHAADLLDARASLPPDSALARLTQRRPVLMLLVLALLPHLVGSFVNISYNESQLNLTPEQTAVFMPLVLGYNAIAYPLCVILGWLLLRPLFRVLSDRDTLVTLPGPELDRLRRHAFKLGGYAVGLALLGWIPGGFIFPLAIHALTGPPGWELYGHFLISFTLSGLIATVYSYFALQYVILRGMYLRLVHAEEDRREVQRELDGLVAWVGFFQLLAALVPLTGAVLLLTLSSGELSFVFRLLVVALIVAGMLGLGIAVAVSRSLREVALLLKGTSVPLARRTDTTAYYG